ncbi:tyrosine--tRNA ligase [Candidatus Trichorickettsia mobilis]|uniref:tyrosine--tRNA ligase n=1 Tax=Candidatus Trichorickettsia mobilis TaxID=1346319 RepID=UPI00292EA3C5|nr:tyrosine--tRNA ligase [Candidatus Trichorickettsia mobilis]
MSFIKDFVARGYMYQCTNLDKLTQLFATQKVVAYVGFDCTASSLHVGNLLQIMILRLLQRYGHQPIIVIGGATTKIGDPTGRDDLRKILNQEELTKNINGIKNSLAKFIKFGDGASDAIILDNSEWLEHINYLGFLRDYGRLISVNRMLTLDSVKARIDREQALTFLEFNYALLQAYDFCQLNKKYGCVLQIGGSDQWGNIVMGVDLCHKFSKQEVYGITTPLLTTSSGQKMGKSVNGAVWLNEEMLSPYEYYQFWRNCADADLTRFTKLYAEFTDTEFSEFNHLVDSDINAAKKQLAFKLTAICHGEAAAVDALTTATKLFEHKMIDANLPTIFITIDQLANGIPICELLVVANLASSKSEGSRLIRGGGAKINDHLVSDENMVVNSSLLFDQSYLKLSSGKKKHLLIKVK